MTVSKKIKTINNKIEQNKAQFNLNREAANISASSSGSISNMNFWQAKMLHWKNTC